MGASRGQAKAAGHAVNGGHGKIGMLANPHTSIGGKSA